LPFLDTLGFFATELIFNLHTYATNIVAVGGTNTSFLHTATHS
jgi:hypothetical protein